MAQMPPHQRLLRSKPRTGTAPGATFAYDVFVATIREQRHDLEQIDVKLGVLIAALAAAIAAALANGSRVSTVVASVLLVPIVIASAGLRVRKGRNDPDPLTVVRFAGDDPSYIKQRALNSLMGAFADNQVDLEKKARYFNQALFAALLVILVLVLGKALGVG
jgi:hypothetical protein